MIPCPDPADQALPVHVHGSIQLPGSVLLGTKSHSSLTFGLQSCPDPGLGPAPLRPGPPRRVDRVGQLAVIDTRQHLRGQALT
jgi:hypothetical protein